MTSLATIIGMIPMALKLGDGRRAVHAHGAGHHRRPDLVGAVDDIYRPRCLFMGLSEEE